MFIERNTLIDSNRTFLFISKKKLFDEEVTKTSEIDGKKQQPISFVPIFWREILYDNTPSPTTIPGCDIPLFTRFVYDFSTLKRWRVRRTACYQFDALSYGSIDVQVSNAYRPNIGPDTNESRDLLFVENNRTRSNILFLIGAISEFFSCQFTKIAPIVVHR